MGAQSAALLLSGGPVGVQRPAFEVAEVVTLSGPLARVDRALRVELSAPDPVGLQVLRRVLDLDADLTELWALGDPWVRATGAGRQLRAGSVLEALAQALAGTNTSYRGTQAMMEQLVGDGPFPLPGQVPGRPLTAWGYRAPALLGAARAVDEGLDEGWSDAFDEQVLSAVRGLRGFGPFAAASVLPLGRWGGTVLWLDVTRTWFPAV